MPESLNALLMALLPAFTAPGAEIFLEMIIGWILCPGRRTVTSMIPFADPKGRRRHDAFHRFLRAAAWSIREIFRLWTILLVKELCPEECIYLHIDDTVHKKSGRKVKGAKFCRDAVRSTAQKTVYVWGLQFVVLSLRVIPPWLGEPLSLPIHVRLYRKDMPTILDLAEEMVRDVVEWLPDRWFCLIGDGFYAPLAGRNIPRTHLISRIRYDAALYDFPPRRKSRARGRPRKKGHRLPTPAELAKRRGTWQKVYTKERGKLRTRLVQTLVVLWYSVAKDKPICLIISRDPEGQEKDDFFFTTDVTLEAATVIGEFANRWAIEDTFRNTKQYLGAEEPQTWQGSGPEKVGAFAYLLYAIIWLWYLKHGQRSSGLLCRPWYPTKIAPSCKDALATLRQVIWKHRFSLTVPTPAQMQKIQKNLIEALSWAA